MTAVQDTANNIENAENKAASLLESIQVFQSISLLQIKKSWKNLLELKQGSLEAFVQQHSDYIIFLLNILDEERSLELLNRLTDAAIIYLSEEELRNLLIQQVGYMANHGGDFHSLSVFMDLVDRPEENCLSSKKRICKEELNVIRLIPDFRQSHGHRHMKYLDRISLRRRESVAQLLLERNLDVAIGLLLFCPDQMLVNIIDKLSQAVPKVLKYFPEEVFLRRFEYGYSTFLNPKLSKYLPKSTQKLLEKLVEFSKHTEGYMLKLIEAFADPDLTPIQKRKIRLEELFKIIQKHNIQHIRIAFHDLQEIGVIEASDLDLIESLLEEHQL